MAELRHSASMGSRASSSPAKRDAAAIPLTFDRHRDHPSGDYDDDDPRRDRDRDPLRFLPPSLRSLIHLDDARALASSHSRILAVLGLILCVAALVSLPSLWSRLVILSLEKIVAFFWGKFLFWSFTESFERSLSDL